GVDTIDGGPGNNTLKEFNDGRFVIQGTAADATLDMGQGTNQVDHVSLTGPVTAGNFRLAYGNYVTTDIPYNALPPEIKSALTALPNIGPDDVTVLQSDTGAPWTITFVDTLAGRPVLPLTAMSHGLVGGDVAASVVTPGVQFFDTLRNIQKA